MQESPVAIPCPVCNQEGEVYMIAHIDEIPYFGEHTQVTVMCHSCGWKQTDFIPAEGQKAGCWSLLMVDSNYWKEIRSQTPIDQLLEETDEGKREEESKRLAKCM